MDVAAIFGMTMEEFQSVMVFITILNGLLVIYSCWLRVQIRKAGDSIDENHKIAKELLDSITDSADQFAQYKQLKNYNKLTSKNNWYIFGLVNLTLVNKNRAENGKLDLLNSFVVFGAAWCKRPEDVGMDYLSIMDSYEELEEPAKVGKPVLGGGHF